MAATPSTMLPLGTIAPDFILPDAVSGEMVPLADAASETATVVMFICNHCPYVIHIREGLVSLAREYRSRGISFIAINSNDAESYPQDAPERMKELAEEEGFTFPYLFDETQEIARAYHAACTPDFYIFDGGMRCVYRGEFDGSRPGNGLPVTGDAIRRALDAILDALPVDADQKPSIGCNIKWRKEG